jgi:methyl-accepting chemotaxis protein
MIKNIRGGLGVCSLILTAALAFAGVGSSHAQKSAAPAFSVDGQVGLASLISLSDGHFRKMADSLQAIAATKAVRSGNWEKVRPELAEVAKTNVPALMWFALPDGSYWSVEEGKSRESLATRPYFSKLLAGQRVMCDLVVSKATGKSVAIIAVPILRPDKTVAGAVGSSIYLDKLSAILKEEMNLDTNVIFYSFDAVPLLALEWDASLIFVEPKKLGEEIARVFTEMLSKEQGVVTYKFRDRSRTVLYRKSPLTGWWYAFGLVESE